MMVTGFGYNNKLEYLFGKQDELQGNILENELIALQPNNFKSVGECH